MDLNAVHFGVAAVRSDLSGENTRAAASSVLPTIRRSDTLLTPSEVQRPDGFIPPEPAAPLPYADGEPAPLAEPVAPAMTDVVAPDLAPSPPPQAETVIDLRRSTDGRLYGVELTPDEFKRAAAPKHARNNKTSTPSVQDAIERAKRRSHRNEPKQAANGPKLTGVDKIQIHKLQSRDQEVRLHEMAHLAAAGPYAQGTPVYTYQVGPDGKHYAVGGHISLDTSPEETPEATVVKMQLIRRASVSADGPSVKDVQVAAQAAMTELRARAQIAEKHYRPLSEMDLAQEEVSEDAPGSHASRTRSSDFFEARALARQAQLRVRRQYEGQLGAKAGIRVRHQV